MINMISIFRSWSPPRGFQERFPLSNHHIDDLASYAKLRERRCLDAFPPFLSRHERMRDSFVANVGKEKNGS